MTALTHPFLTDPSAMREAVLTVLATMDRPMRGAEVQAFIGAELPAEDKAVMQNARANGRAETVWQNHVYRAFRQLKAAGHVLVVASATYELSDSGREVAKRI